MFNLSVYGIFHFLLLLFMTYREYRVEESFYNVLTLTVSKKGLHLCHSGFLLFLIYVLSRSIIRIFLVRVRPDEISVLNENCIYYLADIILIISLFSEDISTQNFLIFSVIISLKCLLWLFEQRINTQRNVKMAIYGVYILTTSTIFLTFTMSSAILKPNINILFSFEFAIIALGALKTLMKMHIENVYTDKEKIFATFGLDISFIMLRLLVTLILFFWTTLTLRIPFNIIRDIFKIVSLLNTTIKNYAGVRRVYNNLEKCENVTEGTCPICRDEMEKGKRILCGHSFHSVCLKQWAEKQQVCPICRHVMFADDEVVQLGNYEEMITGVPVEYAH
jgi:E3 ubiquitin-protein ligase synoviolin